MSSHLVFRLKRTPAGEFWMQAGLTAFVESKARGLKVNPENKPVIKTGAGKMAVGRGR